MNLIKKAGIWGGTLIKGAKKVVHGIEIMAVHMANQNLCYKMELGIEYFYIIYFKQLSFHIFYTFI